jgi:methanogenic corrinoid protein MtbC1
MSADLEQTLLGTAETNLRFDLAQRYLELVLAGDRREASRSIIEAADQGIAIREIYLDVLQPVQREIGRLWQLHRISVAQEHLCTAITQLVMSQLYPRLFSGKRRQRSAVGTCVGGELHEIGMRMVVDLLEMEGWDTFYLGADTPHDAVIQQVVDVKADLLAVSVTLANHVDQAAKLIDRLRGDPRCAATKVLVGGLPFNFSPDLWSRVGADATAPDAQGAADAATRLFER